MRNYFTSSINKTKLSINSNTTYNHLFKLKFSFDLKPKTFHCKNYFFYSTKSKNEILDKEYTSILNKLYDVNKFSALKVNLDNITKACEIFGNPHKSTKYIHVTGTNGKGSVCKKLASVFEFSGFKTGLYISPHITTFRERIQVNSKFIEKQKIIEILKHIFDTCDRKSIKLTYFEYVTLLCFMYFKENNIDIAIMEVGLGGNLDSTNIISPLLSVITSIGLDHMDSLGFTQEEIAEKKAGIIKPNIPCVIGPDCFPRKVFLAEAIKNNSKIYVLNNSLNRKLLLENLNEENYADKKNKLIKIVEFAFNGSNDYGIKSEFQNNILDFDFENKMIARHVIDIFNENYPDFYKTISYNALKSNDKNLNNNKHNNFINNQVILKGINTKQPCRKEDVFEILGREKVENSINKIIQKLFINTKIIGDNKNEILNLVNTESLKKSLFINLNNKENTINSRIKKIFLDVGHNAHGLEKLLFSIRINNPESFIRIVTGFSSGKDQKEILRIICSFSDKIYLASAKHQRALPYKILLERVNELCSDYSINKSIFSHFDDEKEFYRKLLIKKGQGDNNALFIDGKKLCDECEEFISGKIYEIFFNFRFNKRE